MDLITRMMQYSPAKRVTPFEAMCHEYFDDLRDQQKYEEIVLKTRCKNLHVYNKEEVSMSKQFISRLLPEWY